ncbi:MAG: hypothetical protein IK095_01300 [Oscillospiraceae bacterium]|nr:hypothetical protein [Oscillospiraceae bacterium]
MRGKDKCKILKQIRQRIADENDIPYVTEECGFKGACRGTCPRCEAELRYLERELEDRRRLGKTVTVAALCAGLALGLAGCGPVFGRDSGPGDDIKGMLEVRGPEDQPGDEIEVTEGEIAWPEDDGGELQATVPGDGEPAPGDAESGPDEEPELLGDVDWIPEEESHG